MSINHHLCLGPYIVCTARLVPSQKTLRSCTNETCDNHKKEYANGGPSFRSAGMDFCPKCGAKVGDVVVSLQSQNVNHWKMREEVNESLHCVNRETDRSEKHVWVINCWKDSLGKEIIDRCDEAEVSIQPEIIKADLVWFRTVFREEIEKMSQAYGNENVEVRWGLIQYSM